MRAVRRSTLLLTSSQGLLLRGANQSLELLTSLLANLVNFFAPLLGGKRRVVAYCLDLGSSTFFDLLTLLYR
jgi:hypothetical protein